MTKILLLSDIHNEGCRMGKGRDYFQIPEGEDDTNTVLVLAGDIDHYKHAVEWAAGYANRYKAIIQIAGNHEYWGTELYTAREKACQSLAENHYVLDNQTVIIDDTRFIASTLWTDYKQGDPVCKWSAERNMVDFKKIMVGKDYKKLTSAIIEYEHKYAVRYIQEEVSKPFNGKTVVVSHHAPSYKSSQYGYRENFLTDHCFYSNLEWLMSEVDLWCHGHTHHNVDYMVGDCRVKANCKGWRSEGITCELVPFEI